METNKEYLQRFIDSCDQLPYSTGHMNATKKYYFGTDHIREFMKEKSTNDLYCHDGSIDRCKKQCELCKKEME